MIIHISPTPHVGEVRGVTCRLWWGHLDGGGSVTLWVASLGSGDPAALAMLERELVERGSPLSDEGLARLAADVLAMLAARRAEGGG